MSQAGRVDDKDQTDGRQRGDWRTRYDAEAWKQIRREAIWLAVYFFLFGSITATLFFLSADFPVTVRWISSEPIFQVTRYHLIVFFIGCVGGTTFSIKWLIHSVANSLWHQDRFLWRIFVPLTGGVYALAVLALFKMGLGTKAPVPTDADPMQTLALAFLVGYFGDGVSGMLSNIANAIFGRWIKSERDFHAGPAWSYPL